MNNFTQGPMISVITVCYNAEKYIEKTIKSVLNQTYPFIEYIIIDGRSTDSTLKIISKYSSNIDKIISEPDDGIFDAMNKGIKYATGKWINFMNAGDTFYENNVLLTYIKLIDKKTTIAYGNMIMECNNYKYKLLSRPLNLNDLAYLSIVPHQAVLIRTDYQKKHLFNSNYKAAGDYELFYNAHFKDNCKFQFIPIIAVDFDASEGMSKNQLKAWPEYEKVRGNNFSKTDIFILKIKECIKLFIPNVILERRRIKTLIKQGACDIEWKKK